MNITVITNQSIIDIAILYYGTEDGVFDILQRNPTLNLSNDLIVGSTIILEPDLKNDVVKYFVKNKTNIATI